MRIAILELDPPWCHLLVACLDARGALAPVAVAREPVLPRRPTPAPPDPRGFDPVDAGAALTALAARARGLGAARCVLLARPSTDDPETRHRARLDALEVEVLGARDRACLRFAGAVVASPPAPGGRVAVVHVGRRRLEIGVGRDDTCVATLEAPVGIERLAAAHLPPDGYLAERTATAVAAEVRRCAAAPLGAVARLRPERVLFTSAAAHTVATLVRELGPALGAGPLPRVALRRLIALLSKFRPSSLPLAPEEGDGRHAALTAVVIETCLELLEVDEGQLAGGAVREGAALRLLRDGALRRAAATATPAAS